VFSKFALWEDFLFFVAYAQRYSMKGIKFLANAFFADVVPQLSKRNFSPIFAAIFLVVLKAYSVTAPSLPPVSCSSSIAGCPDQPLPDQASQSLTFGIHG
jgi:hypothetical protein